MNLERCTKCCGSVRQTECPSEYGGECDMQPFHPSKVMPKPEDGEVIWYGQVDGQECRLVAGTGEFGKCWPWGEMLEDGQWTTIRSPYSQLAVLREAAYYWHSIGLFEPVG